MTEREAKRLIEKWRKRLVPEWRISLNEGTPADGRIDDDSWYAAIDVAPDYCLADIYLPPSGLARPTYDIEVSIVHELVHCLVRDFKRAPESLETHASRGAWVFFLDLRSKCEEELADRLARVLVGMEHDG